MTDNEYRTATMAEMRDAVRELLALIDAGEPLNWGDMQNALAEALRAFNIAMTTVRVTPNN